MSTKLDLINLALLEVGDQPIVDINDDGAGATSARLFYDLVAGNMFSMEYFWHFAIKKANLGRRAEPPLDSPLNDKTQGRSGFRYAYTLPADYKKLYKINNGGANGRADFEIVGDAIYTNLEEVILDYVHIPPESKWPDYFNAAFVASLAAKLAMPVAENRSLKLDLEQAAMLWTSRAKTADARNRPNKKNTYSPFIAARA